MGEGELNSAIKAASRMWNHTGHQEYSFGVVSDDYAARVFAETGLDVRGFTRTMATHGTRHVRNSHGDAVQEQAQEQVAVRPADFGLIPQIADKGKIKLIGKAISRKPARLEHVAEINGLNYIMLETVNPNSKRLELKTMRIEQLTKKKI
jgi:phage-Barnase-EndoU-ColicinE5/D-RelE like nuclease3